MDEADWTFEVLAIFEVRRVAGSLSSEAALRTNAACTCSEMDLCDMAAVVLLSGALVLDNILKTKSAPAHGIDTQRSWPV